ncbi:signal transduction histidine kinase [Bernardetia litoralis DSM 6794]|uniref:histidine kinase n=1 Tax=Bernardetia litoralis (strain ATCC 23117 / DSM 6794 / NBRC 15988 / NCIMB 1366 / Fx l1 / Sio-4) TaxID=880071 RepID=I4AK44_BERLS|nr:HAMP domain-containing sensor histidine kinase [Bernardetia litoralis]AFM04329.1 signal transduction histidine kinase [Bernardetia litoralis DSM 6794]
MKLLNQSLVYLSVSILLIVSIWSVIFYINMLDEIHDSIDDGLKNNKLLIIQKSKTDTDLLQKNSFDEGNYAIQPITKKQAIATKDIFLDTLMYMEHEKDFEPVRILTTAFEKNKRFYELKIISSTVEEDDLIEDLFWSVFWLYIIVVASILIINNIVLRKLWKPFYSLLAQLQEFRLDNKKPNLPQITTKTKEFTDLQKSLTTLLKHSLQIYQQQRQFIENASHELQTPLAIATNKLELLLENENLENESAQNIYQVIQIIQRLVKLNKSLLLLAKIENKQFLNMEFISINEVVNQSINDLEDFAEFKKIEIKIIQKEDLTVKMDSSLAQILISNLLKNAIFHTIEKGKVEIEISTTSLKISNTAKNKSLEEEKVFHRFYKSSDTTGTGLGLAITKAICNLFDFQISYSFDNKHSFKVDFF